MHSPTTYVPGLIVTYAAPTDTRGSLWRATLTRGAGAANRWRARVPYADGPDAAAAAVTARFNECCGHHTDADRWRVIGAALSLDNGTTYAYAVGPAHSVAAFRASLSGDASTSPGRLSGDA